MTIKTRKGDWMQTVGCRQFWPLDPRVEEIDFVAIASALARQCRYGGHIEIDAIYSVAEHAVHVSRVLERRTGSPVMALAGLHHDDSEAYLVDVPRPVKSALQGYREVESRLMDVIATALCLQPGFHHWPAVVAADNAILLDERDFLIGSPAAPWDEAIESSGGAGAEIHCWVPAVGRRKFLEQHRRLLSLIGAKAITAKP